ncbi:MAG: ATPase [Anaerolineae bacterium]|nr:ATPase [Anaerolineae bacterium]
MPRQPYSRKDRLIKEKRHDVYQERGKWPEPTCCTGCGALFVNGRWTWQKAPPQTYETICPACRRITDRCPAGYVEISGPFLVDHHAEMLNLINNVEKQEKSEHPLERIIAATLERDHLLITSTGHHLARRIGEALARAYKGELSFQYAEAEDGIRVYWQR